MSVGHSSLLSCFILFVLITTLIGGVGFFPYFVTLS